MSTSHLLTTTYTSPTNASFTHTLPIPSPSGAPTSSEKSAYLSSLRKAREILQEKINQELTARMEEDLARVAGEGTGKGVDEGKEEENYGEEVVDEE